MFDNIETAEDGVREIYAEGMRDALKGLLNIIMNYRSQEGEYPDMEDLAESVLPRLINDIPDMFRTGKSTKWN